MVTKFYQEPTDNRLMNVAWDLQDAITDISMAFDLGSVAVEILFLTLLTRSVMNLMTFLVLRNVFKSLIRNLNFLRKNQKVLFTFLYSTLLSFAQEKGRFLFLPRWGKIVWSFGAIFFLKLEAQKALFTAGPKLFHFWNPMSFC